MIWFRLWPSITIYHNPRADLIALYRRIDHGYHRSFGNRNRLRQSGLQGEKQAMRLSISSRFFLPATEIALLLAEIALLLVAVNCSEPRNANRQASSQEITVAAAANLANAFEELGKQFTSRTGIGLVFSFGATADLSKQIENASPFDIFASADVEHIDDLIDKGFIAPFTRAIYARGRLVLWTPPGARVLLTRLEDLTDAGVKFIAIAKPDLAPYGRAAIEALGALDLWARVEPKVVYAQNVAQARQYAASGNADAAFLPLALMKPGEGQYVEVDARLHQPIDQAIGVVRASNKQEAARQFLDFVLSAEGQTVLARFGYLSPKPAE
jgi:molybdate transport system substrate-binding protein